ncbi:MAG: hypothetical protein GVY29_03265 [Spirochaetes bacterium]|jgi:hypothetical protein|nr:hypothetical protein [Spirochaetota bacterium]
MWRRLTVILALCFLPIALFAQETAPEEEADDGYTGVWSATFGPVTLEWILEEEQYEFYAYQDRSIRIGSRGSLRVENTQITFISEETTTDGSEWTEVDLPEEERQAIFGFSRTEDAIRLAQTDRSQFYVEYRTREQSVQDMPPEETQDEERATEGDASDKTAP